MPPMDTVAPQPLAAVNDVAVADVRGYGSALVSFVGGGIALVGGSVALEATNVETPGAGDWFPVVAAASNAPTGGTSLPLSNAALAPGVTYANGYRLNTTGYTYVRARLTARTSGDILARWTRSNTPVESVPNIAAGVTAVTATPPAGTAYNLVTAASTNGALIVAGTVGLSELTVSNPTATPAYVKLYNKATAPTVGTDVPILTIPVPAGAVVSLNFGTIGKRVPLGLGIAVTGAAVATDTTATVAGIVVNLTRF